MTIEEIKTRAMQITREIVQHETAINVLKAEMEALFDGRVRKKAKKLKQMSLEEGISNSGGSVNNGAAIIPPGVQA